MICAKCGHDVPADAPECPWCANHKGEPVPPGEEPVRCPRCGSTQIDTVQRSYNSCCGCLGFLLFQWLGLLLGFLGAGDVDLVCRNCGARWPAGHPDRRRAIGCTTILLIILIVLTLLCA